MGTPCGGSVLRRPLPQTWDQTTTNCHDLTADFAPAATQPPLLVQDGSDIKIPLTFWLTNLLLWHKPQGQELVKATLSPGLWKSKLTVNSG